MSRRLLPRLGLRDRDRRPRWGAPGDQCESERIDGVWSFCGCPECELREERDREDDDAFMGPYQVEF